jgi:hypothetical protein
MWFILLPLIGDKFGSALISVKQYILYIIYRSYRPHIFDLNGQSGNIHIKELNVVILKYNFVLYGRETWYLT